MVAGRAAVIVVQVLQTPVHLGHRLSRDPVQVAHQLQAPALHHRLQVAIVVISANPFLIQRAR